MGGQINILAIHTVYRFCCETEAPNIVYKVDFCNVETDGYKC